MSASVFIKMHREKIEKDIYSRPPEQALVLKENFICNILIFMKNIFLCYVNKMCMLVFTHIFFKSQINRVPVPF